MTWMTKMNKSMVGLLLGAVVLSGVGVGRGGAYEIAQAVSDCGGGSFPGRPLRYDNVVILIAEDIDSLDGLERVVNVRELMLTDGTFSDLSPMAALDQLTYVDLSYNEVGDITPLAGLTELETLLLSGNDISDVSAVPALGELWWLELTDNQIQDISALATMTNLGKLHLQGNPLNAEAYEVWLPQIEANSPGIDLRYDPAVTPGDADRDGDVDLDDFVALKSNFGAAGVWSEGDFDGSGTVDLDDFVILKNNFGAVAP